jgi:hypothetical protein
MMMMMVMILMLMTAVSGCEFGYCSFAKNSWEILAY